MSTEEYIRNRYKSINYYEEIVSIYYYSLTIYERMKTRILRYRSLYEFGIIYRKQMSCIREVQGCIS